MVTKTPSIQPEYLTVKVCDRLLAVASKSRILQEQFRVALMFPGTGLEDEIAAVFARYAKKLSGIISPVRAHQTGLVRPGWKVVRDKPEDHIDLANLDYSTCPVHDDEEKISGEMMMKRAEELGAIGSLGLAAALLIAQDEGMEIFPIESRGKHYFILPLTVLKVDGGRASVTCFNWRGIRWELSFDWLVLRFNRDARFIRLRLSR